MSKKAVLISAGIIAIGGGLAAYLKQMYYLSESIDFSVSGFKIVNLSLTGTSRFNVDFDIKNTDKLKLSAKAFQLSVYAGDKYITTINKPTEFNIVANGITKIDTGFSLNIVQVIKDGLAEVKNTGDYKNLPLTFKGSIKVKQLGIWIKVPYKFTYRISEMMS